MLKDTSLGAHYLIVYPDLATLRKVYSHYIDSALNEKNEAVIVLPFFETTDNVRRVLKQSEFDIDVTKHEKQRSLLVTDSLKGYFYHHKDNSLMDHELSLPSEYDSGINLKTFCLYHNKEFDKRLSEEQREKLLQHHGKNLIITAS